MRTDKTGGEPRDEQKDQHDRQTDPPGQRTKRARGSAVVFDQKHEPGRQIPDDDDQHEDQEYLDSHRVGSGNSEFAVYARADVMKRSVATLVFAGLVLVGLVSLGNWQTRRAIEKDQLLEGYAAGRDAEPLTVIDTDQLAGLPRFTRVTLSGHFDRSHVVLLDNQVHQGRAGVHVFVPLQMTPGEAVLVNLGWLELPDRSAFPTVSLPHSIQEDRSSVTGLVNQPPQVGMRLGEPATGSWPLLTPYLDLEILSRELDYTLAPWVIWTDPAADSPYQRQWHVSYMSPSRHRAYAFQWYSLAAGFVLLCGFILWKARRDS